MTNPRTLKPSTTALGAIRRKSVTVSPESLVETSSLEPGRDLPLVVEPKVAGVQIRSWASTNRTWIEKHLAAEGGLLFRRWNVNDIGEFEQFTSDVAGEDLLDYSYRSTPRREVSGRIYSSTEYPADQSIPLHNEMAYSRCWPLLISFFCVHAASQGGQTPLADSRKVYQSLDRAICERFEEKKVLYVRNYGAGLDLPWQDVFQTSDKSEVETFCRQASIALQWRDDGRLRTRQVCQAVAQHPITKEMVWFNQAHLFHVSALDEQTRESFLAEIDEEDLPRNCFYGDGSPIEPSVLDEIRAVYRRHTVVFPWQVGDVLLLDNMLVAHGREPYSGDRKVVVGMARANRGEVD